MAPSLARSLMRTTTTTKPTMRAFTTTPTRQEIRIPPDSPKFINVPSPPQDQVAEERSHIDPILRRGVLPNPRSIFRSRDLDPKAPGMKKHHRRWVKNAIPQSPKLIPPSSPSSSSSSSGPKDASSKDSSSSSSHATRPAGPLSEYQAWQRAMTASRRQNLAQGIQALYQRTQRTEAAQAQRHRTALEASMAKQRAPTPHDEAMSRTSVPRSLLATRVAPDPRRFVRATTALKRSLARDGSRAAARKDALAHLYLAARGFIVERSQLVRRVEEIFTPAHFYTSESRFTHVWDRWGDPDGVAAMLVDTNPLTHVARNEGETAAKTIRRQRRLAEELTGGPLPEEPAAKT